MIEFVMNAMLWTFALYGAFEVIKSIINIYLFTNFNSDGIYMIIAVKNQEKSIEGFLRTVIFRLLYGKEEYIKDIVVADLDSNDNTKEILEHLQKDYDALKVTTWKDCKEIIENIKEN